MTWAQWLGMGMLAAFFVGIFVFIAKPLGWKTALEIFGIVVLVTAFVAAGALLAFGSTQ